MADKDSVADWSTTPDSNDNIAGVPLGENVMYPRHVNNAFRNVMAQIKAAAFISVPTAGSVTNAMLANMAAGTIKSNLTGSSAAPSDNALASVLTALNGSATSALAGLRNHLINGTFAVWQRGTSFSVATTTPTYTADRWAVAQLAGAVALTVAQEAAPAAGVKNSIRVQRNSGNTNTNVIQLGQVIETANCIDLQGQLATLSFYAKVGANFSGNAVHAEILTGTGADQGVSAVLTGAWTGQAVSADQPFAGPTTRTKFTVPVTIPSGATEIFVGFYYTPVGTAGAADYFEIDSVQLEPGTVATPIEARPYGLELALCQRFFSFANSGAGKTNSTTATDMALTAPVQMRAAPTAAIAAGTSAIGVFGLTNVSVSALGTVFSSSPAGISLGMTIGTTTSGLQSYLAPGNSISLNAEL